MTVTWRERFHCWRIGHHRYERTTTAQWPAGYTYRLCRGCGATKRFRP